MHDSEQEHSSITGCRVTYESTIFYNEANKFSIIVVKTSDPRIPPQACNGRYYGDRMLRFTAVGYELPRTKAVELELDGEWVESKYGYQLQVEQWQEIVPQTADGLLAYLGSGLIKGIGPKTAEDIVATFGPDTLNILDNEPEKLLQIRGITEGKLKDIEESYAESRVLRNLMSLLGPFKITPATAQKIYQNFGPACVDILKKCPYDLCQISGFGFKRVDGIVRKTDNHLHSAERIKGAVLYTLEDARSKSGHLFLPSEDLVKETLFLLNAPIPIPEQRIRAEEVQETLRQMILHGAVVAYKQYLYSPRVFGQEDDTARMIAARLANISVAENIESALESVRESLGITLSQKQEQAVRTAFQHGLTIITGSPGTGKTTVLKAIIEVFKNLHPKGKFALMAPTGRASRRMAESTGVDEARTLHSALGLGTGEEVGDGERVRFVDADLIIVDARYNCTGNADAYREICEALGRYTPRPRVNDCIGVKPEQNARATPQEIHQTYSLLLSMLPLTPTHKAHLLSPRRGLTEEQIARFGFKSTPPAFLCRSYAERLRRQGCTLQGVPGFYQDDARRWTINFGSRTAGILLPAVGMDGLICGMQIRLDTPLRRRDDPPGKSGAKYIWLSSVGKPHGVTSGSPLHFVGEPFAKTVYVTEGLLKADIAHCLTGRSFVAVAGVNSLNGLESALRCMAQNGTKLVVEAYDMDKLENEYVTSAAEKVQQIARVAGLQSTSLVWNTAYKGIDDWQLALRQEEAKEKAA